MDSEDATPLDGVGSDAGGQHLAAQRARLAQLDEEPLSAHVDALDALHRAIVAELDDLQTAGTAQGSGQQHA